MIERSVWFSPSLREPAGGSEPDREVRPEEPDPAVVTPHEHLWRHASALAAARVLSARPARPGGSSTP